MRYCYPNWVRSDTRKSMAAGSEIHVSDEGVGARFIAPSWNNNTQSGLWFQASKGAINLAPTDILDY
jgi:hypothetical protein